MLSYVKGETRGHYAPRVQATYDARAVKSAREALEHLAVLAASRSFPRHRREQIFTYGALDKLVNALRVGSRGGDRIYGLAIASLLAQRGLRDVVLFLDSPLSRLAEELLRPADVLLQVIGEDVLKMTLAGPQALRPRPKRGRPVLRERSCKCKKQLA